MFGKSMFSKSRVCPKCSSSQLQRRKRKGFLQNVVMPRLGFYPWVCRSCKFRFNLAVKSSSEPMDATQDYAKFTT